MTFFDQFINYLTIFWAYFWNYPYLPIVSLSTIITGQGIGWRSLASFRWSYWIIMMTICYMTLYGHGIWYLQRSLNLYREYCYCDAIRIIRMSDTIEGLGLWMTEDRAKTLKYYMCRASCP